MSINDSLQELNQAFPETGETMPVLFVGHGSPMNAIEDNEFSRSWAAMGQELPRPKAILCVSAHWETSGTQVTGMEKPKTIHDFGGFPQALFDTEYPAPGSPALARLTKASVQSVAVTIDDAWGLDHGTWSILNKMFPQADIPVVQLSLDYTQEADFHYALGKELASLRRKGVLILGSGNIVHNLRTAVWREGAFDWALEFDEMMRKLIVSGDHNTILRYPHLGKAANLSIPTNEHFLPLLYTLAQQTPQEQVRFSNEKITMGSLSMRSLWIS